MTLYEKFAKANDVQEMPDVVIVNRAGKNVVVADWMGGAYVLRPDFEAEVTPAPVPAPRKKKGAAEDPPADEPPTDPDLSADTLD